MCEQYTSLISKFKHDILKCYILFEKDSYSIYYIMQLTLNVTMVIQTKRLLQMCISIA